MVRSHAICRSRYGAVGMIVAIPTVTLHRPCWPMGSTVRCNGNHQFGSGSVDPVARRAACAAVPVPGCDGALRVATEIGVGSPFVTMAVLPLMWLAIYERRCGRRCGIDRAGLWFSASGEPPSSSHGIAIIVFVVCGASMGVTLHGLVADTRRIALVAQASMPWRTWPRCSTPTEVNRYRLSILRSCTARRGRPSTGSSRQRRWSATRRFSRDKSEPLTLALLGRQSGARRHGR